MNAEIKPQPPKIPFGGPKLRTFKLNGKPEKSTFLEYLVDDGHDKFLEDLSAGAKNNGCHVSLSAQEQAEQDEINRREALEREKTHASSTGATDDTIHSCEPDLRKKLLKGHVFARGVTDAANPRREFWNNFDMSDPNARRTFYGEVPEPFCSRLLRLLLVAAVLLLLFAVTPGSVPDCLPMCCVPALFCCSASRQA